MKPVTTQRLATLAEAHAHLDRFRTNAPKVVALWRDARVERTDARMAAKRLGV